MKTLVVARWNEDCSWIGNVSEANTVIVQKGLDFPNVCREPSSFLWFIISHYDRLEGEYYFVQGRPFDHCPGIYNEISLPAEGFRWLGRGELFYSALDGTPHHGGLRVGPVYTEITGRDDKTGFFFAPGGQFAINAKFIKSKPLLYYVKALATMLEKPDNHPWCFERLWEEIFR